MRLKPFNIVYVVAVLAACLTLFKLSQIMVVTGTLSITTLPVYQYALPIALLLQSLLVSILVNHERLTPKWLAVDLSIVAGIIVLSTIILIAPVRDMQNTFTGLLVGVSFVVRSIYLLTFTSRLAKTASNGIIYTAIVLVVLTLLIPIAAWRQITHPLQGDEPYYLLISYSLIHDRNINLEENYLRGDSLNFTNTRLSPQMFDNYSDGKLLSRHPPLLPLILVPGFLIARSAGAIYTMILMGTLLAAGLVRLLKQYGVLSEIAVWAAGITVLTVPVVLYSTAIFTELPAAVICVWVLSFLTGLKKKAFASIAIALGLSLAAAALKTRFAVLCLPPVIMTLVLRNTTKKNLWVRATVASAILLVLAMYNLIIFGSPTGRYNLADIPGLSLTRLYRGFAGLLLDQQYGLLPLNPLYFLAIPGMIYLLKYVSISYSMIWFSALIPYYTMVALFAELSGGICPRGRFLIAWTPLLTVPATICYVKIKTLFSRSLFYALASLSVIITLLLIMLPDWQIVYPGSAEPLMTALSKKLGHDFLHIIPSFDRVDHTLFQNTVRLLLIGICTVVALIFIEHRNKNLCRKFGAVSAGLIFLLIVTSLYVNAFSHLQTPWMHVQDDSFFFRGNSRYFWEEPYYWDDMSDPYPSPYRSGVRLVPGSSIFRSYSIRKPSETKDFNMAMEIVARASYPTDKVPVLEITAGANLLNQIQIRSSDFKSYFIPWPYGLVDDIPQLGFHYSRYNDLSTFIDVDKIRLTSANFVWPEKPHDAYQFFPVNLGPLTCHSFDFPSSAIQQGEPFHTSPDFSVSDSFEAFDFSLLFKSGTRGYIKKIKPEVINNNSEFELRIPAEYGSGVFDVLLFARKKDDITHFLNPEGVNIFASGKRAWVGKVHILPAPVKAESKWETVIREYRSQQPDDLYFLPKAFHLSENDMMEIVPGIDKEVSGVIVISHLSSVFEQIEWQTRIGTIHILTEQDDNHFDFILGRQTAEELYEFTGKDVRLPHPQPPVAIYLEQELIWPFELEGIRYDAAYYIAEKEFDAPVIPEKIRIHSGNFPGVWNIFSIALIRSP